MSRKKRILIVDDNAKWREELVETLERQGYAADSAATGQETLKKFHQSIYHVAILDIRLDENEQSSAEPNVDGITILSELDRQGLSEATKVVMLSAYGTKELMRTAFSKYKVADFLSKDDFNNQEFLALIDQIFAEKVRINLDLMIHWPQESRADQFVLNLHVNGTRVKRGTTLHTQLVAELEDLLCRLFYEADSIMVRPLAPGKSGTGVLRVQPFYATRGAGHEVIVKFGDFQKIEEEYLNFQKYVQPFLGGARCTTVLGLRHTTHLGGIIYNLLGSAHDRFIDFGEFYQHAALEQIKETLDRLFRDTCGTWYASRSPLQPINLTAEYQRLFGYAPEKLEQIVLEYLNRVQGKQHLQFIDLPGGRTFPNPIQATAHLSLVRPTYICTTHGDFNQHNLLVDQTGYVWLIDFQGTGQSHILRDVAMLDSVVRFQLLSEAEASLEERLQMEEALCSIERFSQVDRLVTGFSTANPALAKAYATVVHLRSLAHWLVGQNPHDDMSEYFIALLYNALRTLPFSSLQAGQREHALLSASLLVSKLGQVN
jgi:CheY-like chemotaxis protein